MMFFGRNGFKILKTIIGKSNLHCLQSKFSSISDMVSKKILLNEFVEKLETPLIVIIGATGCGKTKLSLELARHYGKCEIISADSMQIYQGLDIATNKASLEERLLIPHHLIGLINPFQQFTVVDFQQMALKSIDEIRMKDLFPIIVGGTNYYIESILWDNLVSSQIEGNKQEFEKDCRVENIIDEKISEHNLEKFEDLQKTVRITKKTLANYTDEQLHEFLNNVDSKSAKRLHHRDRRKVIRCLQVYQQTFQPMSELIEQQHSLLRFENSIILWLDCNKDVLDKRLDERVNDMIRMGLLKELSQFHENYNKLRLNQKSKADYTEGIFQTIGLKEFHQYLILDEEERNSYNGSVKLGQGILALKQRTQSYVTKQLKWIRRRFLTERHNTRQAPYVFRLDTTDLEQWPTEVLEKSTKIIDKCFEAWSIDDQQTREKFYSINLNPFCEQVESDDSFISGQFYCDVCQTLVSGGKTFQIHLKSKKHLYHLKQSQKKQQ